MAGSLSKTTDIAFSGMKAQTQRLKVISENMANVDSVSTVKGGDPYQRQMVTFQNYVDKATGANLVKVSEVIKDKSDFIIEYAPNHPGADEAGYIKKPNVNPLIEMMDMKEAQRTYEANLNVVQTAKDMKSGLLDILQ
ncbi:MAG: flagellar basal body rod protein FlgC [Alphaproteobacteria bacterium]